MAAHPGVGQRGVAVLRVELQRDEGHVRGDPGHHGLHRLVLRHAHVLEGPRQEDHPVCGTEKRESCLFYINHMMLFLGTDRRMQPINHHHTGRDRVQFCI